MKHLTLILRDISSTEVFRTNFLKPFVATGYTMLFTFVTTEKETKLRTFSTELSFTEEGFSLN